VETRHWSCRSPARSADQRGLIGEAISPLADHRIDGLRESGELPLSLSSNQGLLHAWRATRASTSFAATSHRALRTAWSSNSPARSLTHDRMGVTESSIR